MNKKYRISVRIDKLTRCIEEVRTGNIIQTEVLPVSQKDLKGLKKREWLFDWPLEAVDPARLIFKLTKSGDTTIQGLISIEDKRDHIYVHLIESAYFNRGRSKMCLGVPGNLFAFACKLSFYKGYQGYVSFSSKTKLIAHYQNTLGARVLRGHLMEIDARSAKRLLEKYFPKNC